MLKRSISTIDSRHPILRACGILMLALLLTMQGLSSSALAANETGTTPLKGQIDDGFPVSIVADYKDNPAATGLLERDVSFEYSHSMLTEHCGENRLLPDLAKASVYLATAAYNGGGTSIQSLMRQMGYTHKYTSPWYENNMTYHNCDHVAFEIGYADYQGKAIYMVAVRGTSDRKEWYSDFNFGTGTDHYGFRQSALEVLDVIGSLVDGDGVSSSDTIIWTMGHSRGAGVSDMVAGYMSLFSAYSHGIPRGNIFSYNYACPSSTRRSISTLKNIYNFVNPYDAIPKLPFTDDGWEYHRFGETVDLSTSGGAFYNMQDQFYAATELDYQHTNTTAFASVLYSFFPTREDALTPKMKLAIRMICNSMIVKDDADYKLILADYLLDSFGVGTLTAEDWAKLEDWLEHSKYLKIINFLKGKTTITIIPGDISSAFTVYKLAKTLGDYWWESITDVEVDENEDLISQLIAAQEATEDMEDLSDEWNEWLEAHSDFVDAVEVKLGRPVTEKQDLVDAELLIESESSELRDKIYRISSALYQSMDDDIIGSIAHSHTMITYQYWINSMYYGYHGWRNASNVGTPDFSKAGTTIGEGCFRGAGGFTTVSLPEQIVKVCDGAFRDSDVAALEITGDWVQVGAGAFQYCASLASATIPADLQYNTHYTNYGDVHDGSFYGCTGLKTLRITRGNTGVMPDFVSDSDDYFNGTDCYYTENISYSTGTSDGSGLESVIVDAGVTNIGDYAFYSHNQKGNELTADIGDSVTRIGAKAFEDQTKLGAITLPSGLKEIGDYAFSNCSTVTATNANLPESLESIGDGAFEYASAFMVSGDTMTLYGNVSQVGERAFAESGVTGLEIVSADTQVGAGAFQYCASLASATIPADLQYNTHYTNYGDVHDGSFYGCTGLKTLRITRGNTGVMPDFVSDSDDYFNGTDCYYTENISYSTGTSDGSGLESVIVDAGVTGIGDYAFYSHYQKGNELTADIGDSVTRIGAKAFEDQTKLGAITLPSGLKEIGDYAFSSCAGLRLSADHPLERLTRVGSYAFSGCNMLTAFYIPRQASEIGSAAFGNRNSAIVLYGWVQSEAQACAEREGYAFRPVYEPLVEADDTLVGRGESAQLTATMYTETCQSIAPTGWAVLNHTSANTQIGDNGLLSVGEDENAARITVSANFERHGAVYTACMKLTVKKDGVVVLLFDPAGGTVDPEYLEIAWNAPFGDLPVATREGGYVFGGWTTADGTLVTADTVIADAYELALYARWITRMEEGLYDYMLPLGTAVIEEGAFEGVPVEVIYIPDGCVSIEANAFKDCLGLRQIRIPDGCGIDDSAFAGCQDVLIFAAYDSPARAYCDSHANCTFVEE